LGGNSKSGKGWGGSEHDFVKVEVNVIRKAIDLLPRLLHGSVTLWHWCGRGVPDLGEGIPKHQGSDDPWLVSPWVVHEGGKLGQVRVEE
jgi:hypothetical protein